MSARGCTCGRPQRRWSDDGVCAACGQRVLEEQLTPVLLEILCGGTGLVLWRNNAGFNTHWPSGEKRKQPIRYGVATPGGADYIGLYRGSPATHVEVEFKTPRGSQTPEQIKHQELVESMGGIYAICRSVSDAEQLLGRLRGGSH